MANPYVTGAQLNQAVATERKPGSLESIQHACKRLFDLRERLCSISNALHGPRPQDAGQGTPQPQNLATFIDQLHQVVGECEYEVGEIFQSLGIK